jgi:hypothetical protein
LSGTLGLPVVLLMLTVQSPKRTHLSAQLNRRPASQIADACRNPGWARESHAYSWPLHRRGAHSSRPCFCSEESLPDLY